jgi:hypothetical protein
MSTVVAFVDTLCFLHYPWLATLDWCGMLDADAVEIILAPVVVAELDKKKNEGSPKIRQRARNALQKIKDTLDRTTLRGQLTPTVTLRYIAQEPSIDFAAHGLSTSQADDRLIATIIEYSSDNAGASVILITDDTGLSFKATGRTLVVKEMPADRRLKEEPDAEAAENQRLKAELAEFQNRLPRLKVVFGSARDHHPFTLRPPVDASPEVVAARIAEVKKTYQPYKRTAPLELWQASGVMQAPSERDIQRYNDELPKFFEEMETFFRASVDAENRLRRTLRLELWLENYGTAPAHGVSIFMNFPDGMVVTDEKPTEPTQPKPPAPPRSPMDWLSDRAGLIGPLHRTFALPDIPAKSNVSSPRIRRTNSFEVAFEVEKARHKLLEPLDPLYVVFDASQPARSFEISWHVLTDSLPQPTKGRCHVIVTHETPRDDKDASN